MRELAAALLEETELRVVECEDAEQAMASLCRQGEESRWFSPIFVCPGCSMALIWRGG